MKNKAFLGVVVIVGVLGLGYAATQAIAGSQALNNGVRACPFLSVLNDGVCPYTGERGSADECPVVGKAVESGECPYLSSIPEDTQCPYLQSLKGQNSSGDSRAVTFPSQRSRPSAAPWLFVQNRNHCVNAPVVEVASSPIANSFQGERPSV